MQPFKIRCSAISEIMGIKALGETGKTYCKTWVKEQIYGKKKEFTSKYTEKGLTQEGGAIELIGQYMGKSFTKNEKRFEQDPDIEGTPDIVDEWIIDNKCSWDVFTFPLFMDASPRDNMLQLQGYMHITGIKKAKLIYTLMDTPDNIIESEARKLSFKMGNTELDADMYEQFRLEMTYSGIPMELRVKCFDIDYDPSIIEQIKARVQECRAYIETLQIPLKSA